VDFDARAAALCRFDDLLAAGTTREALATQLLAGWNDGGIKLYVLATLLRRRAERNWPADAYGPLEVDGARAAHAVAYARDQTVVVVPRLPRTLAGSSLPARRRLADHLGGPAAALAGALSATCSPVAT